MYLGGCCEFWSLSEDSPPAIKGWRDDADWLAEDVREVVPGCELSPAATAAPPADDVATVAGEACEWTVVADE